MAYFSNFSKTYAKDKLSKCVITVLLMCCYLYRKRSKVINVNAEAKEQGRYANSRRRLQYFYRGIKKRASFPLVLVGAPRKESLARAKLPVG